MRLRGDQLVQIRQSMRSEMVARIARTVSAGAPEFAAVHGDHAMRAAIASAAVEAESHGFEVERDVERYVFVSLSLGHDFANDPQLPWAARALAQDGSGPLRRAARLHDRATHYASLVFGPRRRLFRGALDRLRAIDLALPPRDDGASLRALCVRLYPRKAEVIGHDAIATLVASAPEAARALGLVTPRGVAVFAALQFMIGVSFACDPRVPWAAEILRDPSHLREEDRLTHLLTAAWDYAERWRRAIPGDHGP